ncbi:hypothetical protein NIES2101_40555 [Calothrix sp. HK-06]|nr:hypothetical protein NIES2101_40555 [Calothrix sp. HK-06]
MKNNIKNNSIMNHRRKVTALVLSGVLSVSSSITLIKSATAAPINSASTVTKEAIKVSANRNLPRSVRNAVIRDFSRRQGILPSNISIVEFTEREWRNGCLELAGPGELCTQAIVPGWQVVVSDGREKVIYHTNNNGRNLRVTNRNIADNSNNTRLPSRVRDAVIRAASSRLRVLPRQLNITQAQSRDWKDGCLELAEPNRACSQVIVSGWRVVVGIKDVNLVYHTNESGSIVRLNRTESDVNNKGLSDKAERAVLRAGASDTGLPASELEIGSVEQITVDGCLGLARPNEACTKIAQPAFRVTVEAGKRRLVYHVKPDGSQVRLNLAASNIKLPQVASDRILRRVSEGTGIPVAALSVVNIESGKWEQGRNSSYVWKVTVGNEQDRWVYLSNENGESLQLLAEGLPKAARNAVLSKAAQTAELPQKDFELVSYKRKQWFFGCEDPETLPACTPAPVSGWEVSVKPNNVRDAWVYLVSDNGSQLKLVQGGRQDQVGSNVNIPINIADAVLRDASKWSGRSEDTFRITSSQKVTFPNPCNLTFNPICDRSYRPTPGWNVTVDSGLGAWTYLVSADAKIVNQDQTPALAPRLAEVIKRDALRRSSGNELADLRVTNIKLESLDRFDAEVTVSDGMQNWVYAVDKESTRFEYLPVASIPRAIVNGVLADAQKRAVAKVNVSTKNITDAEQVTWKNGNLGLDGSSTTSSSVKGWRITVAVGRERFVYHTNNFVGSANNKIAFRLNEDASKVVDGVANGGVPIPTRELPPALTNGVIFRYVTTGGIVGRTYETVLLEDGRLIQTRLGDTNDSERRVFRLSQEETKRFQQLLKRQAELFQNVTYPAPSGAADYITYTLTSEDGTVQYNDISSQKVPDNLKVVLKAWNDLTATTLSNR